MKNFMFFFLFINIFSNKERNSHKNVLSTETPSGNSLSPPNVGNMERVSEKNFQEKIKTQNKIVQKEIGEIIVENYEKTETLCSKLVVSLCFLFVINCSYECFIYMPYVTLFFSTTESLSKAFEIFLSDETEKEWQNLNSNLEISEEEIEKLNKEMIKFKKENMDQDIKIIIYVLIGITKKIIESLNNEKGIEETAKLFIRMVDIYFNSEYLSNYPLIKDIWVKNKKKLLNALYEKNN